IQVNGNASAKVQISGLIGQAGLSRQTRAQQLIFVNGRAIESGLITAAIREGYHTALMKGQYPVTFLFLDLDPGTVDVNVHPTKREVRFRDLTGVRETIVHCLRQTLERTRTEWQEKFRAPPASPPAVTKIPASATVEPQLAAAVSPESVRAGYRPVEFAPRPAPDNRRESVTAVDTPGRAPQTDRAKHAPPQQFQIIGVLNKLYVLMENADGLVLVDQHAAHVRSLFEDLQRRMEEQ